LKIIHFASFIEGYLDEFFVKEVLKGFAKSSNPEIIFNRHKKLVPFKGGSKNRPKVIAGLSQLSLEMAIENKTAKDPHLFISGIDSDGDDYEQLLAMLIKEIHAIAEKITIIFVSVRDIETWAEYLLKPKEIAGRLDRGSSKDRIYQNGKSTRENAEKVIAELRSKSCFSKESLFHLTTQSPSFAHFHQQITTFLQNIS